MKGILLAGGTGSRLWPLTKITSKHLLPIYDKPMIYYSLSVLMLAGIRDIAIITTSHDQPQYQNLLLDGSHLGLKLEYITQDHANGISEAFILAEHFIGSDSVCLILGDNLFYGDGLPKLVQNHTQLKQGAVVFAYPVKDPSRYGVVAFDKNQRVTSIEEKPQQPKSDFAVTGLYYYDNQVVSIAKSLTPSTRGELEITDLNKQYLNKDMLKVEVLGRGYAWLDAGTAESLYDASQFVQVIESRQGFKMACIEEIAFRMRYIDANALTHIAENYASCPYGDYLKKLAIRGL